MKFTTLAVAAGLVAAPAVLGAPAAMQERNLYIEKLDDHSAVYTGKWTNLVQQGLGTFEQTLSYTKEKNALIEFYATQGSNSFQINVWSTKASDRGQFTIYCDHTLLGTGNEYKSGAESNSQIVWSKSGVSCPSGHFVLKNDKGAAAFAVDAVELTFST